MVGKVLSKTTIGETDLLLRGMFDCEFEFIGEKGDRFVMQWQTRGVEFNRSRKRIGFQGVQEGCVDRSFFHGGWHEGSPKCEE